MELLHVLIDMTTALVELLRIIYVNTVSICPDLLAIERLL